MTELSNLVVVAVALVDSDSNIFVQRRPPQAAMAGLWEFPGGKIEADESPEYALSRELKEELNIVVAEHDLIPLTFASELAEGRRLILLLYMCWHWAGQPTALSATALKWVNVAELTQLDMPPADVALISPLAEFLSARKKPFL